MRYIYSKIITLFNYYESATTGDAFWYPHVLSGVDLITDKGAILKKYGPDATDNAQLHIRYTVQNGDITIADKNGKILPWIPPTASPATNRLSIAFVNPSPPISRPPF